MENKLFFGDNLEILRKYISNESVDLIYLDPPFNSKATSRELFTEKNRNQAGAQLALLEDFWQWGNESDETYMEIVSKGQKGLSELIQALRSFLGQSHMMAYLALITARLVEMHRVLKKTGSIYLHCHPASSHYLKLILDAIFGAKNFRNEIIWHYDGRAMYSPNKWNPQHDSILFYGKSDKTKFNIITEPWAREEFNQTVHIDEKGREYYWIDADEGSSKGKRYLEEAFNRGKALDDVWNIKPLRSSDKESLGYHIQKPEALLERIVKASSSEDDTVLDPFCGCGTTLKVAERLRRKWIGIDISYLAITLVKHRLKDTFADNLLPYEVLGDPKDLTGAKALAEQGSCQLEWWALDKAAARPAQLFGQGSGKRTGGYIYFMDAPGGKAKKIIVQVDKAMNKGRLTALKGDMDREKAEIGVFITLEEPGKPMKEEALRAGFYKPEYTKVIHYPRVQIITVEELLKGKQVDFPRFTAAEGKLDEQEKERFMEMQERLNKNEVQKSFLSRWINFSKNKPD